MYLTKALTQALEDGSLFTLAAATLFGEDVQQDLSVQPQQLEVLSCILSCKGDRPGAGAR